MYQNPNWYLHSFKFISIWNKANVEYGLVFAIVPHETCPGYRLLQSRVTLPKYLMDQKNIKQASVVHHFFCQVWIFYNKGGTHFLYCNLSNQLNFKAFSSKWHSSIIFMAIASFKFTSLFVDWLHCF